jgi:hypothetical protein
MDDKKHPTDVDLDGGEREILPNPTGLTDRTVIETVLEGECSVSSGGAPAIH